MPMDAVDLLLERIWKGGEWPPKTERKTFSDLAAWSAFFEGDVDALASVANWSKDRVYRADGLPERIAGAWADHLFGEELEVIHPDDADNDALAELVQENDVTEEARGAERDLVVPEGEAWWRVYRDEEVAEVPLLEWHSRRSVIPYYVGRRLMAAGLVSVLEGPGKGGDRTGVYRHFEIHTDGFVEHVLARGTKRRIGETVDLNSHPETEELAQVFAGSRQGGARWAHGLPMLMGRIVNKRGRNPRLGVSEYSTIKDTLLDLNEATSIAAENVRLTAKKRVVVPPNSGALRPTHGPLVDNGEGQLVPERTTGGAVFDAAEDVLIADPTDSELGNNRAPFQVLEYSYDADALITHKRDLVETALTRVGLSPQWVGVRMDGEGFAASGTALRFRLIPTDKAGRGKARAWDRELPRILTLMARLDALAETTGGFGRQWNNAATEPSVTRANPLPVDELEQATVESTLVTAGVRSKYTSVKGQHPEWDDDEVDAELDRIKKEKEEAMPNLGLGGFGQPPPTGDDGPPPPDGDSPPA